MKKIPTLFKRTFEDGNVVNISPEVTEGFEWVLEGEGVATVKWDGACCAIIDGVFMKRYDAKNGKPIPENAIKCQEEADPVTGHLPCWVPCDRDNPADKWFWAAYDNTNMLAKNLTYEAVGLHFQGNPYGLHRDILIPHGLYITEVDRSFDGIKKFLEESYVEGIVFWKDCEPRCKIKRSDFGIPWNNRK